MSWTPRTSAPSTGTSPYDWNAASIYECTWYAYWRVQEGSDGEYGPPCWYTGSGSSGAGAYTNAKEWNSDGTLALSDYNLIGGSHRFGFKSSYVYGDTISGPTISTGACIGALHNPNATPGPLEKLIFIPFGKIRRRKLRIYV